MATTGGTGERMTITISAAAKELGVSSDTILRWFEAGHLPIFVPPGRDLDDIKPGPRGYLIFKADWESFKRRQTFVGGDPMNPPEVRCGSAATDSFVRTKWKC